MLLSRLPLSDSPLAGIVGALDLHISGTPPAFILSQDQTLKIGVLRVTKLLDKRNLLGKCSQTSTN